MAAFLDACRFIPAAGGTADWTYVSAVGGYQSPTAAGALNGALYRYRAESADLTQWEIGYGTFSTSTGVLSRSTVLFNSSGSASKINFAAAPQVAIVALAEDLPVIYGGGALRSCLSGLTLSNDGTSPNTKIDVAAGFWADDGNAVMFNAAAGAIDFTTNGANGLDTGSLAGFAWYHIFAIGTVGGATANFASNSLTPTLPTGYVYKRRLGSVRTDGSSHILSFKQLGDDFQYVTRIPDLGPVQISSTSASLVTLSVPQGIPIEAWFDVGSAAPSGGGVGIMITSPDEADIAPYATGFSYDASIWAAPGSFVNAVFRKHVNTSGQIRLRPSNAATGCQWAIYTFGYTDRRGRDS